MLSAESVGVSGGGDKPKSGDILWNVLLAVKAIEDDGITGVSRVKCVNTLRDKEFCWVIISFPRGISRQAGTRSLVASTLADPDSALGPAVCLQGS